MKMASSLAEAWPTKNAIEGEDDVIEVDATDLSTRVLNDASGI